MAVIFGRHRSGATASVGIDPAGIGRLELLEERGIAAMAVAHTSAPIGDARSTHYHGIISHANRCAEQWEARVGMPTVSVVERMLPEERDWHPGTAAISVRSAALVSDSGVHRATARKRLA